MSLYKRKDSSVWWVKLHLSGKVVQRSTGSADKVKAQEYHDRLKASLWEQERFGVRPRYSWQQAAGRWLEETADKATHKQDIAYLKWLHPVLGALMLDEVTLDVIARIKETRLKAGSKSTANRYLATIRTILRKARDEWEWVGKVPKIKLFKESEGRIRFITPEQVQALMRELPAHQQDMVLFALQTGLRQSNVVKLEWLQVNLEQGHMWVNAAQSKNRKPISVPLNREALAVLHRQLGKHPVRVFTFTGQPIVNANTRAFRNALKRAGIEDFRWHDLRHTWASWHRMQGTPTHELQQLGGWKTGAMVERYAHLSSDHLANAAARLDSVLDGYDLATVSQQK
ncbi:MAG: tyrosine-type recombinase/integrase [Gallionellaceae bacterium]